jgi:hypothetical protein
MFVIETVGGERPEEQEILAFGCEVTAIWRDTEKKVQKQKQSLVLLKRQRINLAESCFV